VPRIDYYDTDGKLLESRGSGTVTERRILRREEFQNVKKFHDFASRIKGSLGLDAIGRFFGDTLPSSLAAKSKPIILQKNGAAFLANLVREAQRTRKEQGAYVALQYSTGKLEYLPAQPVNASEKHFTFSVARHGNIRLVPNNSTWQIIATVHTHYADVAAMDRENPGVRHSIKPEVSPDDRNSATTEKIIVYAVDAKYVHKALPGSPAQNNLARNLDILTDALETYGRV
jgi:hypothetical protein